MAAIRKDICMFSEPYLCNNSSSFVPTAGSYGYTRFYPSYFDPIDSIYFEFSINAVLYNQVPYEGPPFAQVIVYDKTTGNTIYTSGSISSGVTRTRSSDLKSLLTATSDLYVQIRIVRGGTNSKAWLWSARLIIYQTPPILATATYFQLGEAITTKSALTEISTPRRMELDTDDYDGTIAYSFHATAKDTGFNDVTVELYDVTNSSVKSSVTTTTTTWEIYEDNPTDNSLVDGAIHTCRIGDGVGVAFLNLGNAQLIIRQTGTITKTVNAHHVFAGPFYEADTSYDSQELYESYYDPVDYDGATIALYHEATIYAAGGTGYIKIFNTDGDITNSELSVASTSYNRLYSFALTEPTNADEISLDQKIVGGGVGDQTWVSSSRIYVKMTSIPTGINMQANIGDVWKDSSHLNVNVGDVWKRIESASENVGDSWKTIF